MMITTVMMMTICINIYEYLHCLCIIDVNIYQHLQKVTVFVTELTPQFCT